MGGHFHYLLVQLFLFARQIRNQCIHISLKLVSLLRQNHSCFLKRLHVRIHLLVVGLYVSKLDLVVLHLVILEFKLRVQLFKLYLLSQKLFLHLLQPVF